MSGLDFETLDRIAEIVASGAEPQDRDDIVQDIWERFCRYPPATLRYAYAAARSARADFWRRGNLRRSVTDGRLIEDLQLGQHDPTDIRLELWLLGQQHPEEMQVLVGYALHERRHTPRERTRAHRARAKIAEKPPSAASQLLHANRGVSTNV